MEALRALIEDYLRTHDESQAELAQKSGVLQNVISRWLNGQVSSASPRNLRKIAPALGLSYEDLLRAMGELPTMEGSTDPDETELLAIYRQVPHEERRTVKTMLRSLTHRRHHVEHEVTTEPGKFGRDKADGVWQPVPSVKRRYESQSVTSQIARFGFMPAQS